MPTVTSRTLLLCAVLGLGCGSDGSSGDGDATTSDASTSTTSTSGVDASTSSDSSGTSSGADTGDTGASDDALLAYCGDAADEVEARIDDLLAALSLTEKIAMMHGADLFLVDGVWLVEGNAAQGVPGLHMLDGPRGVSAFTELTATAFPVAMMRGATWDPELEREVGVTIATEIRAAGADVVLAPTINVLRHPRWGRAQETYGEDVMHLGAMGAAFIEGVQSQGVIATAKHFALNSIEDTRFDVDVTADERTLREVYLPHFRRAVVDAHVGAVMSAYNSVNGKYCDVNDHLLTDILEEEWQFQGLVMSDWIFGTHGSAESVLAGLDIEMPSSMQFAGLEAAVASGDLPEAEIDASVRRIVRAQFCFELDTNPPERDASLLDAPEHRAIALEAARRGIVLLKNDGDVLPFDRTALTEIVVMGPLADLENIGDNGSSDVHAETIVTALAGFEALADGVTITHIADTTLTPAAEASIGAADAVVIIVGLTSAEEGESLIAAGDRESLALPAEHAALVAAVAALDRPTVVVLEGGASILVSDWVNDVDAVMMAWYPGVEGGRAIAEVAFGDVEPSGRLPVSFPVAESDLPEFDNVSFEVTYELLHGYRHLEANRTAAAFSFGHGLAYTTFAIEELALESSTLGVDDTLVVSVEVTNSGARTGRETVQLYIGKADSAVLRAPKDLRAFAQVELAPGESSAVVLEVPVDDLAIWDTASAAWTVEPGTYMVHVGASSASTPLVAEIDVGP
jgi:beta-glucosidase